MKNDISHTSYFYFCMIFLGNNIKYIMKEVGKYINTNIKMINKWRDRFHI